jgi:hypothetical protein
MSASRGDDLAGASISRTYSRTALDDAVAVDGDIALKGPARAIDDGAATMIRSRVPPARPRCFGSDCSFRAISRRLVGKRKSVFEACVRIVILGFTPPR